MQVRYFKSVQDCFVAHTSITLMTIWRIELHLNVVIYIIIDVCLP